MKKMGLFLIWLCSSVINHAVAFADATCSELQGNYKVIEYGGFPSPTLPDGSPLLFFLNVKLYKGYYYKFASTLHQYDSEDGLLILDGRKHPTVYGRGHYIGGCSRGEIYIRWVKDDYIVCDATYKTTPRGLLIEDSCHNRGGATYIAEKIL